MNERETLATLLEKSYNGHPLHIDLDRQQVEMICAALRQPETARPEAAGFGWVKVSDRMPDRETFCLWRGEDAKGYWYAMEYPGDFPPPISMRGQADSWIPLPWKPEALRSPLAHKE